MSLLVEVLGRWIGILYGSIAAERTDEIWTHGLFTLDTK